MAWLRFRGAGFPDDLQGEVLEVGEQDAELFRVSGGSAFARTVLSPAARMIYPVMRHPAGRRCVRPLSMVSHTGRTSGRLAIPTEGRVCGGPAVIPLAFGTRADWCRNIRAAGGGRIGWQGREYEMTCPQVRPYESIRPLVRDAFPAWERVSFRVMGFTEFLVLNARKLG